MRPSITCSLAVLITLGQACAPKHAPPATRPDPGSAHEGGRGASLMPPWEPHAERPTPPPPGAPTPGGAAPGVPESVASAPPAAEPEHLQVSIGGCDRAACPLDFTFSLPMVAADRLARAAIPAVVFEPPQKGRFAWQSPNVLRFTPDPDALAWGHKIDVTIKKATPVAGAGPGLASPWRTSLAVPFFQVGGKVASWPVVKGRPRFVGFLNQSTGQMGSGPLL